MTNKITREELNQLIEIKTDQILNEKYNLSELDVESGWGHIFIKLSQGELTVGGIIAAMAIIYYVIQGTIAFDEKKNIDKRCKKYKRKSVDRLICLKKVSKEKANYDIKNLEKRKNLCDNSKDPSKCKKKIDSKISELKDKLDRLDQEVKHLEKQKTDDVFET